jgi:aryl-alcohol dehydrogenase-like predicted oxidoreductase
MVTSGATRTYRDRFADEFARAYFRRFGETVVSSVGVGTYLGDPTDEADDDYRASIRTALERGVNVVDTAINYRHQRSERVVGQGELAEGLPPAVAERLDGETSIQRAINFARSGPGVTSALVGMGSPDHVAENVAAGTYPPMGADAFDATLE